MDRFGPLAALIGEWEGEKGIDVSYHHAENEVGDTPYREEISFKPFGPVDNGAQSLYGLDYRMAAWRADEENPFHTEIGYWMWCSDLRHVMRGFLVPRLTVLLAGCECEPDASSFTLRATAGDDTYGVLNNPYLTDNARCVEYECTVTIDGDTFSYEQDSVLDMNEFGDLYHHTDRNTLTRVGHHELPPRD